MAVIRITPADLLAGRVLEKGGYTAIITEIDGPSASKSNKSVNMFIIFQLTKGPSAGKELKIALSSGNDQSSLLGNLMWYPLNEGVAKIQAAIKGTPFASIPLAEFDIDTDELKQKPLDLIVGVATVDGSLINTVNGFVPVGQAAGATAPF